MFAMIALIWVSFCLGAVAAIIIFSVLNSRRAS